MPDPSIVVVAFGGRVFGMGAATGERVWSHQMRLTGQNQTVRLAIHQGSVYAMIYRELACLDLQSGRLMWNADVGVCCETLLVGGDRVFAAGAGKLRVFALDGAPAWEDDFSGQGTGDVALAIPGAAAAQADRG